MFASIMSAYNPLAGDEGIVQSLVPTLIKTPLAVATNRAWYGSKIKPDYDTDVPASARFFRSLSKTTTGKASIEVAEFLSTNPVKRFEVSPADMTYFINQYQGGSGKFLGKMGKVINKAVSGENITAKDIPVLNRFLKNRSEETILKARYFDKKDKANKVKQREKVDAIRRVSPMYEEIQMLKKEGHTAEAKKLLNGLSNEDYSIYKVMKSSDMRRKKVSDNINMLDRFFEIRGLVRDGNKKEALRKIHKLSDADFEAYKRLKADFAESR